MSRSSRKLDHIKQALGQSSGDNGLKDVTFVHNSLPDVNMAQISLNTNIGGLQLSSPIIINAMTGGAKETLKINEMLAIVANRLEIPIAVGSQMAALRDESVRNTYEIVRQVNSKGIIIANLGGEASVDQAKAAIDMIEANALQIHLNPMQELIMPEGDRDFTGVLHRIEKIVDKVNVPVIVKEVGFGMSRDSCMKLSSIGVSAIDVGGSGGTNFAKIENSRRDIVLHHLNEWGLTTSISLLEANSFPHEMSLISSGGITSGMDIAKSITLGASAAGMAGIVLKAVTSEGVEGAIQRLESFLEELRLVMTVVGAETIEDLKRVPIVVSGQSAAWCASRDIDTYKYARRLL